MSKKVEVIYKYLLSRIESNAMTIGMQLPTEQELSKKFLVSRPTISKALSLLAEEGYIDRKQGKGIYIRQKREEKNIDIVEGMSIGLLFPMFGKGEIFSLS